MKYLFCILTILIIAVLPISYIECYNSVSKDLRDDVKSYQVIITCYYPEEKQTDSTPFITASNKKIDKKNPLKHRWVAVSRDLKKELKYGSKVLIQGTGFYDGIWYVNDLMNKRHKNRVDLLISEKDKIGVWKNCVILPL